MLKVLIIDDQKDIRDSISNRLEKDGFKVLKSENGKEGLEIASKEKPDLVLLDLQMPVMDGFETIKKLRSESEWGKNARVVVLTNFAPSDEILKKMVEANPLYYMIKTDWSLEEISNKIKDLIGDPNPSLGYGLN